jgi:4,5:9,10-diseco-3-hydroxy-5,9,17-trioxoandrosta-1(10),2-diene-4-oate hydrolase
MTDRNEAAPRRRRAVGRLALAGAVLAAPAVAHAIIMHRLRAPERPRWGRTHRFGGRFGQVVFQEIGSGPVIVLLHALGPGFDGQQWRDAAEALARRFRVLVPDLPGWGRSAKVAARPDVYLEVLADFLHGAVREPVVLAGAGMAASYALWLAAEHPRQVRAVALAGPEGLPEGWGGAASAGLGQTAVASLLAVPLLRETVLDALTSRAALTQHLRHCAYAAPERVDAAVVEHHYRVSHLPAHRQALAAYWRGELDLAAETVLQGLRMPVWIAWGAGQAATATDSAEDESQATLLPPGSRVEVFAGTGTLPHAEQPLAWSAGLGRFVDRLEV